MSQVTELAWIPLKEGHEKSESGLKLKDLSSQLLSQPGLEGAYYGTPSSHGSSVEFVNVWANEAAYRASQSSELHSKLEALTKDIIDFSDPKVKPYHNTTVLKKPFADVASAPIVEMAAAFLPADVDQAAFQAAWEKAIGGASDKPDGFIDGTSGWGIEEVIGHPDMPKAKLFLIATGWESAAKAEAASAASQDRFKELEKFSKVYEMHRTTFQKEK